MCCELHVITIRIRLTVRLRSMRDQVDHNVPNRLRYQEVFLRASNSGGQG